jgi:hypothetical protein
MKFALHAGFVALGLAVVAVTYWLLSAGMTKLVLYGGFVAVGLALVLVLYEAMRGRSARARLLVIGLPLVALGAVTFVWFGQSHAECSSVVGLFAPRQCQRIGLAYYGGLALAGVGAVLSLAGLLQGGRRADG